MPPKIRSVLEDWLRLRVALGVLGVTTASNITQIQAYTGSVVGSTVTVVDRARDEPSAGRVKFYVNASPEPPRALFGRVQELPTTLDFVQFQRRGALRMQ